MSAFLVLLLSAEGVSRAQEHAGFSDDELRLVIEHEVSREKVTGVSVRVSSG